jgi:aspartyl-tRNA(Asn)/glutamyl-tRNA(Gln) amidotransferase subunit A
VKLFPEDHETIEGVSAAIRERRATCVRVLEDCLAKVDEWEPKVRAWVLVDREGAIKQARRLDEELASGHDRGPLHGIPIGIKDIIDVAGLPTAAGSRLWSGRIARNDADLVARLRKAGAVILGKTVTTPYAWIDPPVTRNPWNLERTPGGSSSGSAAAVACGMCLGAIGTQTGGSITRPASFCGVAGCKPSHGYVADQGILPFARGLDHPGPIARCVTDLALLLNVIRRDTATAPSANDISSYSELLTEKDREPLRPLWQFREIDPSARCVPRIGRLSGLFETKAEPAARHALDQSISSWREAGAEVREVDLPEGFDDVHAVHRVIMASEAGAFHEQRFREHPDDYPPQISALLAEGLATGAKHYIRAQECRSQLGRWVRAVGKEVDVFATPATIGPAPGPETTGDPAFNSPWSLLRIPTVSFPVTLSPEGLPLAVQLVGRFIGESDLFGAALWCEDVLRRARREGL